MDPLAVRFSFKPYRIRFKAPVRTAHGLWADREGVWVRLEAEDGRIGWGEAAPVPHFGMESAADVLEACKRLPNRLDAKTIPAALSRDAPSLANALAFALAEVREGAAPADPIAGAPGMAPPLGENARDRHSVAALLPAGRAALAAAGPKAEAGFRSFKWKVGTGAVSDELALLDDLCAALPAGARLRLDANGAWDRRAAERWLERCAERPVEFVEQPVAAETRGACDLLLGLAADYPTPIALDESLVGVGDLDRWFGAGWPGFYVIKPLLLADPFEALKALAAAHARVVFSSALETAVGARAALRAVFDWPGERYALGFGVWPLFEGGNFDGPAAAPFLRRSDVGFLKPKAAWDAMDGRAAPRAASA
ncbi:MAG: o-succinylbenzoate synthase [Opitutaceae bacterium]